MSRNNWKASNRRIQFLCVFLWRPIIQKAKADVMETENSDIVSLIFRDFASAGELEPSDWEHSDDTLEHLRRRLALRLAEMLHSERDLLFSTLYRIDVSESSVVNVMRNALPGEIPALLADLIIERQIQKVKTRRYYRERSSDETH